MRTGMKLLLFVVTCSLLPGCASAKNEPKMEMKDDTAGAGDITRYPNDQRFQNIWKVVAVDGISVNADDFAKSVPIIEFDANAGEYSGDTGCNRIRGRFSAKDGRIVFGPGISTRMFCEKNEFSDRIGEILSDSAYSYVFADRSLVFESDGKEILRFQNMD